MLGKKKNQPGTLERKQFKTPNAYVIIFCIIAAVAVLTWFIPGGQYQLDEKGRAVAGTYSQIKSNPQGLWDILMAPIIGMVGSKEVSGAISISLTIMLFGSFLQMMDESGSIKLYLKRIANENQKNYHVLIWVLVFVMGIFGTVEGAYEEGFVYLLMFMPIILALGLDTMVTVMIVVLGTQGGCLASIINPFSTGIASGIAGISPGDGIALRVVVFLAVMSLVALYICRYADKIQKDPKKSPQFFRREDDLKEFPVAENEDLTLGKEQKIILQIFCWFFIIMIVSLVPWSSLNEKWTFFEDFAKWLTGIPVLGAIIGKDITPFGSWYFNELNVLILITTFIAGRVLHFDVNKIIDIIIKGAAGLVSTAFIVPLARGIQVVMTNGLITPTILSYGEHTLGSLPPIAFVVVCLIFYFILAIFIPSSTGLAAATMSIMAPLAVFAGVKEEIMIDVYLMALGLAKMIMPTSIVVMTCSQVAHIDYGQWVKSNWKFVLTLFGVSCLFLIIGVMI